MRAFYLDLQSWAIEDPARWGPWVARCPIPPIASRGYSAGRRRMAERVADRTRTRQPMLDLLTNHIRMERDRTRALLAGAEASDGQPFVVSGVRYVHVVQSAPGAGVSSQRGPRASRGAATAPPVVGASLRIRRGDGGPPISVEADEGQAFWSWAAIEVLRLTGIRHEELLDCRTRRSGSIADPTGRS